MIPETILFVRPNDSSYYNWKQDDWATYLPAIEFAYNRSVHEATNLAPFETVYGFIPKKRNVNSDKWIENGNDKASDMRESEKNGSEKAEFLYNANGQVFADVKSKVYWKI